MKFHTRLVRLALEVRHVNGEVLWAVTYVNHVARHTLLAPPTGIHIEGVSDQPAVIATNLAREVARELHGNAANTLALPFMSSDGEIWCYGILPDAHRTQSTNFAAVPEDQLKSSILLWPQSYEARGAPFDRLFSIGNQWRRRAKR